VTNLIPIFPLGIVVYPGEELNLHIFEERYKQLINDCFTNKKPFGIPAMLGSAVAELGTMLEVIEIVKLYDDGKMDVKTKGVKVFRVLEIIRDLPEKMYDGAIVTYPENDERQRMKLQQQVLADVRSLHDMIHVKKDFKKADDELTSYDLAHHAGLNLNEEYELLSLMREDQRLEYLKRHLAKILPVVSGMEGLKEKIQLNGHFKELKGFNL
jgi:Lon protease-like protein